MIRSGRPDLRRPPMSTPILLGLLICCAPTTAFAAFEWRPYLLRLGASIDGAPYVPSIASQKPTAPKAPAIATGVEILDELDAMVGMEPIKRQLLYKCQQLAMTQGPSSQKKQPRAMHMAFLGQGGSGKTVTADIYARALHSLGLIKRPDVLQANRGDLVAQYVGQTPARTQEYLTKGRGGVIVIDHVAALVENSERRNCDFGGEALAVIGQSMQAWADDTVFILVDKKAALDGLSNHESGVRQQVSQIITFPTLDASQLQQVLEQAATAAGYTLDQRVVPYVLPQLASIARRENGGGAARVKQMLDSAIMHWQMRQSAEESSNTEAAQATLAIQDFDTSQSAASLRSPDERVSRANAVLDKLKQMPGLEAVYDQLHGIMMSLAFDILANDGTSCATHRALHMAFIGPPGTGKTTVAQIFGECLKELGVLRTDTFLSRRPADFISQGGGRTAAQAREALEEGLGGITFIDEAYGLVSHHDGAQALEQLLLFMETEREDSVVILAGYENEMDALYDFNPGFRRRISETVNFPTYDADSLMSIFVILLAHEDFTLDPAVQSKVYDHFARERQKRDFGNAGAVRVFSEKAIAAWKARYVKARMGKAPGAADLPRVIQAEDLQFIK